MSNVCAAVVFIVIADVEVIGISVMLIFDLPSISAVPVHITEPEAPILLTVNCPVNLYSQSEAPNGAIPIPLPNVVLPS